MSGHALLSPSASSRWLNCTPSARLESTMPETNSTYAEEGTLAHSIGELMIRLALGKVTKTAYKKELKVLQSHELYSEEMLDHCEEYSAIVMQKYTEAVTLDKAAVIDLEHKFDLSQYIPEGYGRVDNAILSAKKMFVIDLKYGKGVPVKSENNKQLMLYALGALLDWNHVFDIEEIELTIVQPRIDNTSSWTISVADLMHWADTELKEKAALAWEGAGEFMPGDHCQFCKVRATCRANANRQLEIARHEFRDPDLLEADEIADILGRAKMFDGWLTAVKDFALHQAVHAGVKWPGFKLVEGKSNRVFVGTDQVVEALETAGYKKDEVGAWEIFSITKLEKEVLGKKKFNELLTIPKLVIKPKGKPTLAPADSKKPELNSLAQAQEEFNDGWKPIESEEEV